MKKAEERIQMTAKESERFEALVWQERNVLLIVAKRVLGSSFAYLAEDCVGETLLIACQKAQVLLHHENPEGWLIQTVKNTARNMMRKYNKDHGNIPLEDMPEIPASENDFENVIFLHWVEQGIPERLIDRLTSRERQIYELMFRRNMSVRQVSQELNITESTVYNIKKSIVDKITNIVNSLNFSDK